MTNTSLKPILEIAQLSKSLRPDFYKAKVQLLKDINLSFPQGRCTAIMGHNGAGKTTTIRSIFGLVRPDKGRILFQNHLIKRSDYAKIGYMPETNKLPLTLTPLEFLSYQLKIYRPQILREKRSKDLIEAKLRETELWEHRHKRARLLSKGMGRKLAWAAATIHEPELLILDEPFSGLDPVGRHRMGEWIQNLKSKNVSIIMCTHEFWSVRNVCDEIYVIRKGEVVFSSQLAPKSTLIANSEQQTYLLDISGLSLEQATNFSSSHQLPKWQHVEVRGFVLHFVFKHYHDAALWLQKAIAHGFLVTNFCTSEALNEAELLRYF